jgi:uncharacterized protein
LSDVVQPFHIMCKPVCGTCNLDCRYCYYTMKPRELYPETTRFMMTDEILASYSRQYLEAMPVRCEFGWQGGEPLLAGKDFFRRAVEYQKRFGRSGQTVSNGLQTNGTLLDDEWCAFLAASKFLVGVSLDGPADVHDANRRDRQGNPTWARAWAGVELLRKHKAEFNVLVTLNSANAPHAGNIYRFFVNRDVRYLQFIQILERQPGTDEPTDFSCTPDQLGRWMLDVFRQWAARDVGRVSVRFIDDALHAILYGRSSTCVHSERCAAAYVLEHNGDLYACDHFVYKEWLLGNIMATPMVDLLKSPRLEEFAALKTDLPLACRDCEFLAFCRGGCPKHHRPIGTDAARVNHFCEGYKRFFREALPELRRIAEYIRRGELPPTPGDAARQAVAQAAPRLSGVPAASSAGAGRAASGKPGRNDPCPCGSGRKYKRCCGREG